ncbi:hypothetical protein LLG96_12705 [bacterium]|nr:hypothetical protein [bacterium]
MNNPAFIVDGQMEKRIVQNLCPGQPVRLMNCNGKNVTYDAAAKHAATLIRLLKRYYPIIIVFDKEKRTDSSDVVARSLLEAIATHDLQGVNILIGVPDCMIENWMLADITAINLYYNLHPPISQSNFEGKNGKSHIRLIIGSQHYSETQDGPLIFNKCNVTSIYKNSISFRNFFNLISSINCKWLSTFNPKDRI